MLASLLMAAYVYKLELLQTTVYWSGMFLLMFPPVCNQTDSCMWQWILLLSL